MPIYIRITLRVDSLGSARQFFGRKEAQKVILIGIDRATFFRPSRILW